MLCELLFVQLLENALLLEYLIKFKLIQVRVDIS